MAGSHGTVRSDAVDERERLFVGQRRRGGVLRRMKTESVYPEHGEEYTRDEVLVLIDDCIRWYNHERIKQSLGWMSPVQYRQSQGMAA